MRRDVLIWVSVASIFLFAQAYVFTRRWDNAVGEAAGKDGAVESLEADSSTSTPSASPTFREPIVLLYLSARKVRGDFALRETPEAVCSERANRDHGCETVSAVISTKSVPARKRLRGMKRVFVTYRDRLVAHDVSELWLARAAELHATERVWVGVAEGGGADEDSCDDWKSTFGYGTTAHRDLFDGSAPCDTELRLLCACRTFL